MLKDVFKRLGHARIATPPAAVLSPTPPPPPKSEPQCSQAEPLTQAAKIRVLFVCIGNSCRSPMALGFAQRYGDDVMFAESAGVYPIDRVDPASIRAMRERNIDISDAFPKGLDIVDAHSFDLIINMSGQRMSSGTLHVEEWNVPDPITRGDEEFRKTADLLEQMVMRLILQLRLKRHPALSQVRG